MSIQKLQKTTAVKKTGRKTKKKDSTSSSYFYIGMAVFLMLITFLGFWPSYFSAILPGKEVFPPTGGVMSAIHVHAAVFMAWLGLLLVETVLIARKKIATHMKIGRYGLFLGAAVVITGLLVLFLQKYAMVSRGDLSLTVSTIGSVGVWMQMVNFAVLLGLGYTRRRKPDYHKRYMLFATIALMPAALVRTWYIFGNFSMLIFVFIILGIVLGNDLLRLGRIHKATLIGTGLFVVDVFLLIAGFA